MKLFDFCCPTKSKKTIDYISKWIDETDIELKQIHTDLSRLITNMNGIVAEDLAPIFDEYARNYDYSSVIPELNELSAVLETKATVPSGSVNIGDIVVFGANKSLVDSGTKLSDISGGGGTSIHSEGTGTAVNARASVFTDIDSDPGSANGGVIGLTVTDVNNQTKSCEIDVSNFDNLTKALSGGYANKDHSHSYIHDRLAQVTAEREGDQGEEYGVITLYVEDDAEHNDDAQIHIGNIGNLKRALNDPSTTPENTSDKLITSKAVYDALARIESKIPTHHIVVNLPKEVNGTSEEQSFAVQWIIGQHAFVLETDRNAKLHIDAEVHSSTPDGVVEESVAIDIPLIRNERVAVNVEDLLAAEASISVDSITLNFFTVVATEGALNDTPCLINVYSV